MPLDRELFAAPATRGQVAEAELIIRQALIDLAAVIDLQLSGDIDAAKDRLERARQTVSKSEQFFDELVGWRGDD